MRSVVRAPEPVIEDACQFAWSRLMHNRHRVHSETALSWLVTTALHEARKLVRRTAREVSLELALEQGEEFSSPRRDWVPQALVEDRERLLTLSGLPQRQQRLLWLYGVGLSYQEIAHSQGCTPRTVERQLQNARSTLRARL